MSNSTPEAKAGIFGRTDAEILTWYRETFDDDGTPDGMVLARMDAWDRGQSPGPFGQVPMRESVITENTTEADVCLATEVLFRRRHSLPSDIIRSLQDIWVCASAARFGKPYEDFIPEPEFFTDHNVAECEADD
jgi:hypothetical protein